MGGDFAPLVRATYKNAILMQRDTRTALDRAVGIVLGRGPQSSIHEVRREVARMLQGATTAERP
jgi:hypothetical protein